MSQLPDMTSANRKKVDVKNEDQNVHKMYGAPQGVILSSIMFFLCTSDTSDTPRNLINTMYEDYVTQITKEPISF